MIPNPDLNSYSNRGDHDVREDHPVPDPGTLPRLIGWIRPISPRCRFDAQDVDQHALQSLWALSHLRSRVFCGCR